MKEGYYNNSKDFVNRWIISYADLVTLLLVLFLAMYAINNANLKENIPVEKQVSINKEIKHNEFVKMPEIQNELMKEFGNDGNVTLLKDNRGLIIRLKGDIAFGTAETEIQPDYYDTLNKIVDILSKNDNPVIIEGHTDSVPIHSNKYLSNWELSAARATSVISYILKTGRINKKRLSAVGYGDNLPVAENTSNSGRTKNRRVDIIILSK